MCTFSSIEKQIGLIPRCWTVAIFIFHIFRALSTISGIYWLLYPWLWLFLYSDNTTEIFYARAPVNEQKINNILPYFRDLSVIIYLEVKLRSAKFSPSHFVFFFSCVLRKQQAKTIHQTIESVIWFISLCASAPLNAANIYLLRWAEERRHKWAGCIHVCTLFTVMLEIGKYYFCILFKGETVFSKTGE